MKRVLLVASFLAVLAGARQSQAVCAVTNTFSAGTTAYATQVNQNLTDLQTCIVTLQAHDTTGEMQTVEGVNIILATEIDSIAELNAIVGSTLLTSGGDAGTPSALVGTNISGTAASLTAGAATALAANPSDCGANTFAVSIVASGNLTCTAITLSGADVTGTLTVNKGGTGIATATADAVIKGNGTSAMVASGVAIDSSNNVTGATSVTTSGTAASCMMYKDKDAGDGSVYTECFWDDGAQTCTTDADGVCDGS